jgi:hypothetical protein
VILDFGHVRGGARGSGLGSGDGCDFQNKWRWRLHELKKQIYLRKESGVQRFYKRNKRKRRTSFCE